MRQVSGPRHDATELQSWVTWTPQFHESLQKGNIKRLDLELFFSLRSPAAQRMYRFLDKRFYNTVRLSLDLMEFACGHIGFTECENVAVLKRRLAPAIAELEEIGFIARSDPDERYQKIKAGVWRVHFEKGGGEQEAATDADYLTFEAMTDAKPERTVPAAAEPRPAASLVAEFYKLRGQPGMSVGPRDLEQAQALLDEQGDARTRAVLPFLSAVVRKEWPECRSFSGAIQKYLPDALKLLLQEEQRQARREEDLVRRRQETEQAARQRLEAQQFRATWATAWDALTDPEREMIRQAVLTRHPHLAGTRALLDEQCLRELSRRAAGLAPIEECVAH